MRKLFDTRGRFRLFRFIRSGSIGDVDASVYSEPTEDREQTATFNSDAYLSARKHMAENEAQKAMAIFESRHDRWKAGGPL